MFIRLLIALTLLTSCSSPGYDVSQSFDNSADKLAEIKAKPYIGGIGPGGVAAVRLSGLSDDSWPGGILFTRSSLIDGKASAFMTRARLMQSTTKI